MDKSKKLYYTKMRNKINMWEQEGNGKNLYESRGHDV